MNSPIENPSLLADKIAEVEAKLEALEQEIAEIGMPAAADLKRRTDALRVEEHALKRNIEESLALDEPDSVRVAKIEALLRHIESEESDVEHEADFLHQAAPSSVTYAAKAVVRLINFWKKGKDRVVGEHHPFGQSVFVNHTHDNLVDQFGLKEGKAITPHKPAPTSDQTMGKE